MSSILPRSGRCSSIIRCFRSAPISRWRASMRRDHITLKVWERGAGLTKACGTAACAAMAAGARIKLIDRKCRITLPGGDL